MSVRALARIVLIYKIFNKVKLKALGTRANWQAVAN